MLPKKRIGRARSKLLARRCIQLAQPIPRPDQRELTRWGVFEASERELLVPLPAKVEGCADASAGQLDQRWN